MLGISTDLHIYLVGALMIVMLLNLLLPIILSKDLNRLVYWMRIGYFGFWMILSMAIFGGIMAYMFTDKKLTLSIDMMILASVVLMFLDGYRAIKNGKLLIQGKEFRSFSSKIVLLEIAIVAATWIVALWR